MKFVIDALYLGQLWKRIVIYERIEYFPLRLFFGWRGYATNICIVLNFLLILRCSLSYTSTIEIELLLPLILFTFQAHTLYCAAPRGYKI